METGTARQTVLGFFEAYLVRRDLEGTLAYLLPDVQWVGTGAGELTAGAAGVRRLLEEEFQQVPQSCAFLCGPLTEAAAGADSAMVLLTAQVQVGELTVDMRATAACVQTARGWRIASIHASLASADQEAGEYFPNNTPGIDRKAFEYSIGTRSLDLMSRSIPGGMMGGYLEPGFPLYFINARMLAYLGYRYEEFVRATGGLVINSMHPGDRARVDAAVAAAFAQEQEYEVQYRMRKKDGSYIWVNDVGKKGTAEDGRAVCISVVRDISGEVARQEDLRREAQEEEQQARRYNQLFQSVLCGIVQYRLDEHGAVVFENANQEAIRIFGYTPAEFWEKQDWDLAALIVPEDRQRILDEISHLQAVGDKQSYEYRLCRKDGSPCWIIGSAEIILSSEGREVVQSVFLDIDERKRAELRSRMLADQVEASNEVLRLALEHTTTFELYYDVQQRRCRVPARLQAYGHLQPVYTAMPESLAAACAAPDFQQRFCAIHEKIHAGERTASLEFCGLGGAWWRETLTVLSYDESGAPALAIGLLEDITPRKQVEHELEQARSRDSLTGLYNKETGLRLVQELLAGKQPGDCCGMMLLDMDDFETLNREEGGAFADAVLQEVAAVLRAEMAPGDIAVRLGGDEFMLLLRGCTKARATVVGPRIAEQVRNLIVRPGQSVPISVSIGMCVTDVAEDYNGLYRCAESTLKYVKERQRGQAACYLDTSNELGISLTQLYTEEHPVNAIDRAVPYQEDLVSFALELLGKSKKLDDAVFLLLARVGKTFRLDRVSILEANRDFLSLKISYQWARRRQDFQRQEEVYLTAAEFEGMSGLYDGDGLCEQALSPRIPAMASSLHAGIWDGGVFAGSMCFEAEAPGVAWKAEQRRLLQELVKIVPSFLMKARADAVSRAKTDFLSRMSHEIRTPMNAIAGMTTIAKSVAGDQDKTLECLEKIESANSYLLELINDILDMSRIESGKLELNVERMELGAEMAALEALLTPQARQKGLTLRFENRYADDRPLLGDKLRLHQVLINIIGNAIKFTEAGGSVRVLVEPLVLAESAVLRFSVKDTGIGIAPEALSRIFNAFEQADKTTAAQHGGTGLGLSISSRLVQMMGGALDVKSRLGKGSEFFFTVSFGYAPDTGAAAPAEAPRPAVRDFEGKRILLAEDNALNQEIARTLLEMNGFTVVCAADGQEAVEQFRQSAPGAFDAILMDIRMPVMDGLEATRVIRTLGRPDSRTVPIIAVTANAFDEDSKKSLECGMNGHLAKPLQLEQLLDTLGRCMEKG